MSVGFGWGFYGFFVAGALVGCDLHVDDDAVRFGNGQNQAVDPFQMRQDFFVRRARRFLLHSFFFG